MTPEQAKALQERQRRGGLTPEQDAAITEKLRREGVLGEAASPTPPQGKQAPRPSAPTTSATGQFGTGLTEGVAKILGAPVDLANAALSLVGLESEKPFMGSEFITDAVPDMFMEGDPQTPPERILRTAGQVTGETTASLMPLLGLAQKTVGVGRVADTTIKGFQQLPMIKKAASQNPKGFKRVTDAITHIAQEMAAMDPAKLVAAEMALATGSGTAGQIAIDAFPESPEIAETVGQLVGSFGMQFGVELVRLAFKWGRTRLMGLNKAEREKELGDILADKLGSDFSEAEEELSRRIQDVERLQEEFPGFDPTTGETMGPSGGISAQEKTLAAQDPRFAQQRRERLEESQRAIRRGIEDDRPGGPDDIQAFRAEAKESIEVRNQQFDDLDMQAAAAVETAKAQVDTETRVVLDAMDERIVAMDERITQQLATFPEGATQAQRGEIIRKEYLEELNAFREQTKQNFAQVDGALPVPADETLAAIDRLEMMQDGFLELPDDWIRRIRARQEVIGRIPARAGQTNVFTFREMQNLRASLGNDIRRASREGDDQRVKFLSDIVSGVEVDMSNIATNSALAREFPEAVQTYRAAARFHEAGHLRLKASLAGEMRKHQGRRYMQSGEAVADAFLAGETPLDDFMRAIGHRPTALSAMRESVRANFLKAGTDLNGRIAPGRANAWIKRIQDIGLFRVFPELRQEFGTLTHLQGQVNEARKLATQFSRNPQLWGMRIGPAGEAFNESSRQLSQAQQQMAETYAWTRRSRRELDNSATMAFIGDDANLAARKVWGSQEPVKKTKEVMAQLKSPEAIRGFQTAMWDEMVRRFESKIISAFDRPALQGKVMGEFLDRHEGVMLAMGYTKARIQRMRQATKASNILAEAGRPLVKGDSATAEKLRGMLMDWGPLLSRLYAGPLGRQLVSWQWIWGERIMRNLVSHFQLLSDTQAQDMLMAAFFDPKVARDLALAAKAKQEVQIRYVKKRGADGVMRQAPIRIVKDKKSLQRFHVHLANLGLPLDEHQRQPPLERDKLPGTGLPLTNLPSPTPVTLTSQ